MQRQTNPFAIVSLILGVIAFFADCVLGIFSGLFGGCTGLLIALLAIIFGHIARSQISNSQGTQEGEGIALAGLIMGYITILVSLAIIGFFLMVILGIGAAAIATSTAMAPEILPAVCIQI